jgi:hypothetical protein
MTRALEHLSVEHTDSPKAQLFHGLKPFLTGGTRLPSQEGARAIAKCCAKCRPLVESAHLSRI